MTFSTPLSVSWWQARIGYVIEGGAKHLKVRWYTHRPRTVTVSHGGSLRNIRARLWWLGTRMKQSDLPLVRPIGAKLSPEAMRFIAKVAELFPGSERDIIIVRTKHTRTKKQLGDPVSA
jgi:hypothetical protein